MRRISNFKFLISNFKKRIDFWFKISNLKLPFGPFGFTLVELLLYAGLFTILLVVLLQIFTALINLQLESETKSALVQDGQYALSRLSYDITRADVISFPTTLGATSSALTLSIGGVSYAYTASHAALFLNTDSLTSFATTLSNFTVTRLQSSNGLDSINISFILTGATVPQGGPKSETFQTTVSRRTQ